MPTVPQNVKLILAKFNDKDATAMDRAEAFKQLSDMNYTNPQIAGLTVRSAQAVEQGLILASASPRVAKLVRQDRISPTCVIQVLRWARTSGRDATVVIEEMVKAAMKEGKERATPKNLPKELRQGRTRKARQDSLAGLATLKPKVDKALAKLDQAASGSAKVELTYEELQAISELLQS